MTLDPHEPVRSQAGSAWWKNDVLSQIYPRSFADSDGDGVGDLQGIRSHLEQLGVDFLWLSPIYRSQQADNVYDISGYQSIDPIFGTLEDFDGLVAYVHARGMKLVMDLVVNHTSDEHPWFVESRSSTSNPKRDWYRWPRSRDGHVPGDPGAEPTNWESLFSGPAWTLDETTREYYLHLFDRRQPDLSCENPEVREAGYAMMRWWLARGVDGFGMDVISRPRRQVRPGPAVDRRPQGVARLLAARARHRRLEQPLPRQPRRATDRVAVRGRRRSPADVESLNFFRDAVAPGQDVERAMSAIRHIGRDNARTPAQGTDGPQAGLTTSTPWIGVNPDHT